MEDRTVTFIEAAKLKENPHWLSLIGTSGNGKTMCATHAWKSLRPMFKWFTTQFCEHSVYWPDLIDDLKTTQCYERFSDMKNWPLLFIDDVFTERDASGFSLDKLNTLLGSRIGKWTIITANSTLEEIERVERRIGSRLVRPPNICVENLALDYALRP
jgi:DNA replication protein DnaC